MSLSQWSSVNTDRYKRPIRHIFKNKRGQFTSGLEQEFSCRCADAHVSAALTIHDARRNRIWQLTSRAITHNIPRPLSWVPRLGAADEGETADGCRFERLALYADSSSALVSVDPGSAPTG